MPKIKLKKSLSFSDAFEAFLMSKKTIICFVLKMEEDSQNMVYMP